MSLESISMCTTQGLRSINTLGAAIALCSNTWTTKPPRVNWKTVRFIHRPWQPCRIHGVTSHRRMMSHKEPHSGQPRTFTSWGGETLHWRRSSWDRSRKSHPCIVTALHTAHGSFTTSSPRCVLATEHPRLHRDVDT